MKLTKKSIIIENYISIIVLILLFLISIIIYYNYGFNVYDYRRSLYGIENNNQDKEYFVDAAGSQPNSDGTSWSNNNQASSDSISSDSISSALTSSALTSSSSASSSSASSSSASSSSTNSSSRSSASMSSDSTNSSSRSSALTRNTSSRIKTCSSSSRSSIPTMNNEYTTRTPCLNKTDDFDTWCRYYSDKNPPVGYNVNSMGLKELLIGSDGDCYANGISDDSKAVGVCGYNYTEEVKKLTRPNEKVDYNIFTDCKYMKTANYTGECANLLNINESDALADQITSYDCNPGFARAKCLNKSDRMIYNNNFGNLYDMNTTQTKIKDGCICYS
jgi:hypothetical protein